jgi:hypothetical protein
MVEVLETKSASGMAAWAHRPDDIKFNTLGELVAHTEKIKDCSFLREAAVEHLSVLSRGNSFEPGVDPLYLTHEQNEWARLTHLSFNQFCSMIGARAGEYRKLPAAIAQIPLSYLAERVDRRDAKILYHKDPNSEGELTCRALNSPSYGRIWNYELAKAVQDYVDPNVWTVPDTTSFHLKTGFITTNDRKAFIFMVDEKHPIQLPGSDKPLYRGFYAWNSEVGDGAAGIAEFLFFSACANRAIMGLTEFKELYIRHTCGAPDRWVRDAAPKLKEYVNSSPDGIQKRLEAAKNLQPAKTEDGVLEWMQNKGFALTASKEAIELARDSIASGADPNFSPYSIFNLMMGMTAKARTITNNDDKVEMERAAGKMLLAVN